MKLILLEKVAKLGNLGDTVNVRPGFGRNFLVPQGIALPATKENVAMFESRRAELEAAANEKLSAAETRAAELSKVVLKLNANASDEGKLFGSIGPREVAEAVEATGVALNKSEVVMGEGPIRNTGAYAVMVQLHADVTTEIQVIVNEDDIVALAEAQAEAEAAAAAEEAAQDAADEAVMEASEDGAETAE